MAVRGTRNMDQGAEESIEDRETVRQLQRQTRDMYIKSVLAAVVLTAVGFLIP